MEVLVCSDSICVRETASLTGIKQFWLIAKAEVVHEMACGAWALNSAVDTSSGPYSEDFRHVSNDVVGKQINYLLFSVCSVNVQRAPASGVSTDNLTF